MATLGLGSDTAHILEQMRAANPAPSLEQLAAADLDLVRDLVTRRRSAMTTPVQEQPQQARPEEPTRSRWMRPALAAGLAAIVVFGTLGVAPLIFSGGANPEVFVAGEDDLCEWVSEEEITKAARAAFDSMGVDWDGTATPDEVEGWDCVWMLAQEGSPVGAIQVNAVSPTEFDLGEITEYAENEPWTGALVSGYPGVNDNIMVGAFSWSHIYWVSNTDDAIQLYLSFSIDPEPTEPEIVVANAILEELFWTP